MPEPHIVVVVVNWNNAADTLTCLASLRSHEPGCEVVVVDNGSDDGSRQALRDSGLISTLLCNDRNLGFTGGFNRGLRHALDAGADVVAVLNNDTELDGPAITALAATIAGTAGPVAVAPLITYADDPTVPWFGGGLLDHGTPRHIQPAELAGLPADGVRESQWLTGCALVADRDVWTRVGCFDDAYFLFFEDADWSARARGLGVRLLVDPSVVVRHGVSRSFRGSALPLGTFFYARNGVRYHRRFATGNLLWFLRNDVIVPPVRGWLGRAQRLPAWPFGWFGALCGLVGLGGPAPRGVRALARRAARRDVGRAARSGG